MGVAPKKLSKKKNCISGKVMDGDGMVMGIAYKVCRGFTKEKNAFFGPCARLQDGQHLRSDAPLEAVIST